MADSNIAGLPAGAAIADTDLIAGSDAGSGTLVKKTGLQFNTYIRQMLANLPTSDPHVIGTLWNNGGVVAISQPFTRSLAGNTGAYALTGQTATLSLTSYYIIADGDSLTFGQGATPSAAAASYPVQLVGLLGASYGETNLGVSGRTIPDLISLASTDIYPLYSASYVREHLLLWIGSNDLAIFGDSAATAYANYITLLRNTAAQAQSVGVKVYIYAFTLLPRNTAGQIAGYETLRQTFNTSVRGNYTDFADALIDVGNDATIGGATAYNNATYYSAADFTHLTTAGYGIVAGLAQTGITGLSASPPAPVNKVIPTITGTTQTDNILTAHVGNWVGAPVSFTYQWKRGGVNISAATASTYQLVTADEGSTITVTVTGTGEAGSSSATSSATATITSPYVGNLFVAPRDASGDRENFNNSSCTLTLDSVAGPDGAVLADTIALGAGGYMYKAVLTSTNGTTYTAKVSLRATSPITVRGRIVVSNFADQNSVDFNVTTSWQLFTLVAGTPNSGTGEIQFGIDTRVGAGGDGLAKTFYADKWFIGP